MVSYHKICNFFDFRDSILRDDGRTSKTKHLFIIVVVSKGYHLRWQNSQNLAKMTKAISLIHVIQHDVKTLKAAGQGNNTFNFPSQPLTSLKHFIRRKISPNLENLILNSGKIIYQLKIWVIMFQKGPVLIINAG